MKKINDTHFLSVDWLSHFITLIPTNFYQLHTGQMTSYDHQNLNAKNRGNESNKIKEMLTLNKKHGLSNNIYSRIEFQNFPNDVFSMICENISVKDILNLSLTCSVIRRKVEGKIYTHLRIIDIDHIVDEDELVIQRHFGTFKDESLETESWWVYNNISNIKSARGILYLVYDILTTPQHGNYLRTIEINPVLKPSPWQRRKDHDSNSENSIWNKTLDNFLKDSEVEFIKSKFSFFKPSLTLFDCLLLLLDYTPRLESLIVSRFSLECVSKLLAKTDNLKELKIMIYEHDNFVELPFNKIQKLEKLRIKFQENTEQTLEKISLNFYNCGIFNNLKSLRLKYDKTDFNYLNNPTWYSFFKSLPRKLVFPKLKGIELKDCFFGSDQHNIVNNLSVVLPLHELKWLSLQIYEYSHKGIKHSRCSTDDSINHENTVLLKLARHLKKIEHLTIKPTKNCKECQINSIWKFLSMHKKLRKLWISTDSLNQSNYDKLLNALYDLQALEQLAYFDQYIDGKLIYSLKKWFIIDHGTFDFDIFKNYESEKLRQDIIPIFNCYIIEEFKNFNERESDLLVLFWQKHVKEFGFLKLLTRNSSFMEMKLFGYNFKVDGKRRAIMLYISKVIGYVDLLYY